MLLYLMLTWILSCPIYGKQHSDSDVSDTDSLLVLETSIASAGPVADILKKVIFLDINDYVPKNYVLRKENVKPLTQEGSSDDIVDVLDLKKDDVSSKRVTNSKMILSLTKPSIEKVNVKNFKLKENKPIQRFTSRPFVPTPSTNKVARLRPVQQFKSVNDTRKVQPARRLISHALTSRPLRSRPLTSPPQTTPYPTTILSTTSPSTTPGICRSFCNLVGKIAVKSGLPWTEELLHSFTTYYKEVTAEIVVKISEVFQNFYGTAFEFASVESYSKVKSMIYVQFYVQFNGYIISDVTTANLKETFEDSIRNGFEFQIGRFLLDMNQTEFHVVDTSHDSLKVGNTAFPDWAWIALIGGLLSLIIIVIVASVACVQGYRRDQVLKRRVLSQRVLEAIHEKHFARGGAAGRYKDRRDMWALQRDNQAYRDRNSGNQGSANHDNSTAGLITGLDNTWQDNSSRFYDSKLDPNTSLENSNLSERNKLNSWSQDEAFDDESVFKRNSKLRMSREEI